MCVRVCVIDILYMCVYYIHTYYVCVCDIHAYCVCVYVDVDVAIYTENPEEDTMHPAV